MTVHLTWTLDSLIEEYRQHYRSTRGLRDRTLDGYARIVRLFALSALGDDPIDPTLLRPSPRDSRPRTASWHSSRRSDYAECQPKTIA